MNRILGSLALLGTLIVAIFGQALTVHAAQAAGTNGSSRAGRPYRNSVYRYSLSYPGNWRVLEDSAHVPTFLAPGTHSACQVTADVQQLPGDPRTVLAEEAPAGVTIVSRGTVDGAASVTFRQNAQTFGGRHDAATVDARFETLAVAQSTGANTRLYTLALIVYLLPAPTPADSASCAAAFEQMARSLTIPSANSVAPLAVTDSSSPSIAYADQTWQWLDYTGTCCAASGQSQPNFKCAEYVSRALTQDGLMPGLSAYSSPASAYGNYNGYDLLDTGTNTTTGITGLYQYLTSENRGVDIGDNPAFAAPGDVVFYYDQGGIVPDNLEHVAILVQTGQTSGGSDTLIDAHNVALQHYNYAGIGYYDSSGKFHSYARTIVHVTPDRIGYFDASNTTSGTYYVNEGGLAAHWTAEASGATAIAMAGARIGYLDGSGNFYVKEGSLSASWDLEATGAKAIALFGNLIGYLDGSGNFWVKQGSLSASWVDEHNNSTQIALSGYNSGGSLVIRIGYLDTSGAYWVKEGGLSASWTKEATNVSQIALSGNRIGFVDTAGNAYVKAGGLSASWSLEKTNAVELALAGDRIGVLDSSWNYWVKEGGLGAFWTEETAGNAIAITLAGDRIGYEDNSGNYWVKEGGLSAFWTEEATNVNQIALPDASMGMHAYVSGCPRCV